MLISALCDYYDILARSEKVLPEGYSNVKVHYVVSITEDGGIDDIINCQEKRETRTSGEKIKISQIPKNMIMPERTEKTGIDANIVEHRPLYLFGLNLEKDQLTPKDRTGKAEKSHEEFVRTNLKFLEELDTPLINAYRQFLLNWQPEQETQNQFLLGLGKDYGKSNFAFCLSGFPEQLLHEETAIKEKWEKDYREAKDREEKTVVSQCAVSGQQEPIARIHSKIKGVSGGLATGTVLVGFNNESEYSYGKEQSYNSNISERSMKKYTEALNYLLADKQHRLILDDVTIIFWAMDSHESYEDLIMAMLYGQSDQMDAEQTQHMLKQLLKDGRKGIVTEDRLNSLDTIKPDVMFYMVGLKPNSSRLAVKFIYRRRYGEVIWNISRFQRDLQMSDQTRPVPIGRIKSELISPKSRTETVNPALMSKLMESVLYGTDYPAALLETVVRRVKTDGEKRISPVRTGLIKACINRKYNKEEIGVALNRENHGSAYLCGRLFAVLEKLQQEASNNSLNRTIKDAYFSSASSTPAIIFPKLIRLAQNHLNKVKYPAYYNKLVGEIIDSLDGEFPAFFALADQGRFIVGYYQQYESFFVKDEKE